MEQNHEMHRVPGTLRARKDRNAQQVWQSEKRPYEAAGWAKNAKIRATVRFDDSCSNGAASLGVTADIWENARWSAGGCQHDAIAEAFPELARLIPFHLFDSRGPMHYIANTIYHAGNRDCRGHAPGDVTEWRHFITTEGNPFSRDIPENLWTWLRVLDMSARPGLEVLDVSETKPDSTSGKPFTYRGYTIGGFDHGGVWHKAPFKTERAALEVCEAMAHPDVLLEREPCAWSEGKPRDLDAARSTAVWPEATDEQLCAPRQELEQALKDRLPALVAAFRAEIEAAGLQWLEPTR